MSAARGMTHDEWVQAALAACVEQGHSLAIEDPATLDFLADVFSHPGAAVTTQVVTGAPTRKGRPRKGGQTTDVTSRGQSKGRDERT